MAGDIEKINEIFRIHDEKKEQASNTGSSQKHGEAKKILIKIICILTIYTFIINILAGIVSEKNYFENYSKELFYKIRYTISFWE